MMLPMTLEAVVAAIDAELTLLARQVATGGVVTSSVVGLQASWSDLVRLLDLPRRRSGSAMN
jgi:hypothetical protein